MCWRSFLFLFFFLCQRSQKACNLRFHFFLFFSSSSILVECKETNQFAVIQCRWLFNCTGVHSSLYTVDCTHVLEQPGMNIFSYVLVQGWIFSSTLKTNASSKERVVAISPCFKSQQMVWFDTYQHPLRRTNLLSACQKQFTSFLFP